MEDIIITVLNILNYVNQQLYLQPFFCNGTIMLAEDKKTLITDLFKHCQTNIPS
jgi:hypothetical protein